MRWAVRGGGWTSKTHLACEQGRTVLTTVVTAGHRGHSPQFTTVLDRIRVTRCGPGRSRTRPQQALADRAYTSKANRATIRTARSRDSRGYGFVPAVSILPKRGGTALTDPLDTWLASAVAPHRIAQTITAMADAEPLNHPPTTSCGHRLDRADPGRPHPRGSRTPHHPAPDEPRRDHGPGNRARRHHHRAPRRRPSRQSRGLRLTRRPEERPGAAHRADSGDVPPDGREPAPYARVPAACPGSAGTRPTPSAAGRRRSSRGRQGRAT